jgi:hypothetical protein
MDGTLHPGEYVTAKGWGHLQIEAQAGALTFSIQSVTGEDYCELEGTIDGKQGVAKADSGPTACIVELTNGPLGINVTASTPAECKTLCGDNGSFEGDYRRVGDGCGRTDLAQTRATFQHLYDKGNYKEALAALSPVLSNCQPTLDWEEEGGIRNDLAITQFRNGLYTQCLATLDKYVEDADQDDDKVIETWPPALADRYLGIIRAARTNIALCRTGL